MSDLVVARQPFIDGEWVAGAGAVVAVESPSTGDTFTTVDGCSPAQVDAAIAAARRAFDDGPWPALSMAERVDAVRRLGDALVSRRSALVETVIAEAGCPRGVTEVAQVGMALASIDELADLAAGLPEWEHNEVPLGQHVAGSTVRLSIRRYAPAGVVAAITPAGA